MSRLLPFLVLLSACGRPLGIPEIVDGPMSSAPPAGAANAITCGGVEGTPCDRASFCEYASACGGREAVGTCTRRPDDCTSTKPQQLECGCDGVTYASSCLRQQAGQSLAHVGACAQRGVCDYPTPASCVEHGCTWFVCPPAADCDMKDGCIPDCRTTGCPGDERCDECEVESGAHWLCMPKNVAC